MQSTFKDLVLPNGLVGIGTGNDAVREVTIRELDGDDEDMLRGDEAAKDVQVLNRLLVNVITRIGTETNKQKIAELYRKHMLLADTTFILLKLREFAIDPVYRYDYTCPACKKIARHSIDLRKLKVNEQPVDYRGMSTGLVAEHDGHVYEFRQLLAEKDTLLLSEMKEMYAKEKGTRELLLQIKTIDGEPVDAPKMKKLSMRVRNAARVAMDSTLGGIDTDLEMDCRKCNAAFKDKLPVHMKDFFFPGAEQSECLTARPFRASGTTQLSSDADGDGTQAPSGASPSESASST